MKITAIIASLLISVAAFAAPGEITQAHKDKAASLVKQMTLQEKISMIGGAIDGFHIAAVPRLGIPAVRMADGPQGVRNKTISTFYPAGIAAAASWNRAAVRDMGAAIGEDARVRGIGIMLGPGVNIYRSALCGRNFEYFGEDPFLASEMAVEYIEGMQAEGVMATIKHFAFNNSEYDRHGLSSNVDERTANEIYFPTFRKAVEKAHVGAVMTSYNMVNGVHSAENPWLIKDNLRKWGFDGIVMSDWTSTYTTLGCLEGGLDLEMPRPYMMNEEMIRPLLDNGVITEDIIDEKVQHILQTLIAFDLLKTPAEPKEENSDFSRRSAYNLAIEAPVLLKNDGVLPLAKKTRIAVMGSDAFNMPRGGGSGNVHPAADDRISVVKGLKALGKNYPVDVLYPVGDSYDSKENIALAEKAGAVVVVVGFDLATEKENSDRTYALPKGQEKEIEFALAHGKKVIVVVFSGGEYDLGEWGDKASAILSVWYAGQSGGTAIADLLTGKANPSGRLPFTFWGSEKANPLSASYYPTDAYRIAFKKAGRNTRPAHVKYNYTEYSEGVFVGYRGVEHFNVKPLYPFGYGLSYTSFAYEGLSVVPAGDGFDVSFTVRNTGKVAGSDVPQIYVAPVSPSVLRPARELKGFEKVSLPKGASQQVSIHLSRADFAYYSTADHDWKVDAGTYKIQLGTSSQDIVLEQSIKL